MDLNKIKDPSFLKQMNNEELEKLSTTIRKEIIEKVSKTGGHLSSNLGIVDLTLALYKAFNPPKDKIIFDVGHQCYTQKIITGRYKEFDKLRKYKGLSGFQKRKESIYDVYEAGHSSTSISAAAGFAYARDLNKENYNVVAIIGDGSIGNGLAYEALNHIGELKTKIIVILNDNEMSINENIGAIHNYLDKIRSGNEYEKTKEKTKTILDKIPLLGKPIKIVTKNIKNSIKSIYLKDGYFFEELGFKYYGPINGHDFKEMETYFNLAQKENGPVLIHTITIKGKGFAPALNDKKGIWHGTPAFDINNPVTISKSTWPNVITKHLIQLARNNKNIIAITPAMASGSKLLEFKNEFKERFIDVGIAEEHAVVMANSLSLSGKIPFVFIYSTFLQRAYDEIEHDVARMNTHTIICIDRCGIVGPDGETHQGIYDVSILLPIPNLIICAPSTNEEAADMLYTASITKKPFCIRYSKEKKEYHQCKMKKIEIGSWTKLKKGKDAYIITYGDFVQNALEISNESKYSIGVINARFIKPIDEKMLNSINTPIFVYEEVTQIGSLGSYLKTKTNKDITIYAIKDTFVQQGSRKEILEHLGLDTQSIKTKIEKKLS